MCGNTDWAPSGARQMSRYPHLPYKTPYGRPDILRKVKPLLTTTPQQRPPLNYDHFFLLKYFLYLIQLPLIPKLRPTRYSTITISLSGQNKEFLINLTPFIRSAAKRIIVVIGRHLRMLYGNKPVKTRQIMIIYECFIC